MAAAGAFGLLWFVALGGAKVLDPTHVAWLLRADHAQHLLGWLFYRISPWGFPPGTIETLLHPVGTSVGQTVALPWLALVAKLGAPWLPVHFQYLGWWIGACFVLQGVFGARLVQRVTASAPAAALGGALFVLAPILPHRIGHGALAGQWLLLALFELHLRDWPAARRLPRRGILALGGWVAVSAGVHPYLAVMVLVLAGALVVRWAALDHRGWRGSWPAGLGLIGALAGLHAGFAWLFGHVGADMTLAAGGFGAFSAGVLSLVNSMGRSALLPRVPTAAGQYEGFAYLGLGVLVLALAALLLRVARPVRPADRLGRRLLPLTVACLGMALFALSSRVTLAGQVILDLTALYRPVEALVGMVRSSGRFMWPLHYLILTASLAGVTRTLRDRPALLGGILAAVLALQAWDQGGLLRSDWFHSPEDVRLTSPTWELARGRYRHLVLMPPALHDANGWSCPGGRPFRNADVPVAYKAYELGLTLNSAYVARLAPEPVARACEAQISAFHRGPLDAHTVYAIAPHGPVPAGAAPTAVCGMVEGWRLCVRGDNDDPLARWLRAGAGA